MILHEVPAPEEVTADLEPMLDMLWQALEVGAASAVTFFTSHGLAAPDDRGLAAHLTRYQAKKVLDGFQQDTEFERDELPFSGLLVRVIANNRHYVIRVRRSWDGLLPRAQSDVMQMFYWQPELPYNGVSVPSAVTHEIHLMLLWATNDDYTQVTTLTLALPRAGDADEDVDVHWTVEIPHPATTITGHGSNPAPPEAPAEDLQIEDAFDEDEQTGE
jgi:hypothetical protein